MADATPTVESVAEPDMGFPFERRSTLECASSVGGLDRCRHRGRSGVSRRQGEGLSTPRQRMKLMSTAFGLYAAVTLRLGEDRLWRVDGASDIGRSDREDRKSVV